MARLGDRLGDMYRRKFVGREDELTLFRAAISAERLPFAALYVYGPGGIGKTMLLRMFQTCCVEAGIATTWMDGRSMEASPAGFRQGLAVADGAVEGRHVVLLDTYEALGALDDWLRDVFLPELSEETLVVMAGRDLPAIGWRADAGWQNLYQTMSLRNLSASEGLRYLTLCDVPAWQQQDALDFTGGHPLALALVADLYAHRGDVDLSLEASPDVIHALLQALISELPGPEHRASLECCALVRVLTEPLLARMMGGYDSDVSDLFMWLRSLSFIDSMPGGLFVHDLAREMLMADLRWRNPERCADLHSRARAHYLQRFRHPNGHGDHDILFDYLYLHRHNSLIRPFFDWHQHPGTFSDLLRSSDAARLLAMVERHEGKASAELAAHWLARQPHNALVFRTSEKGQGLSISGWMLVIDLHEVTEADLEFDPATQAAYRCLHRSGSLRTGDAALLFRFWMALDDYQSVSQVQNMIFIDAVKRYLTTARLAYTFFPCADADFWAPIFEFVSIQRTPEADFEVDGHSYGVFAHDWRQTPPDAWLSILSRREAAALGSTALIATVQEAFQPFTASEFDAGVKDALRAFARPDEIRGNLLLRSRLVEERIGPDDGDLARIAALRAILLEVATLSFASPRDGKLYRTLELAYFAPVSSQERAAERLDVSFATFRRYLKAGVTRLTEALWQRESEQFQK